MSFCAFTHVLLQHVSPDPHVPHPPPELPLLDAPELLDVAVVPPLELPLLAPPVPVATVPPHPDVAAQSTPSVERAAARIR
jgi:hypothetical protein